MSMDSPVFRPFPSIARLNRDCIITEKIDGTNGCVVITESAVYAQSRERLLIQDTDPFGFALWVEQNKDALRSALGPGYHFGEWWGHKIQRSYGLTERRFSLFNVARWKDAALPPRVFVVPTVYEGRFTSEAVTAALDRLQSGGSLAAPGFSRPEGVVIWHVAAEVGFKVTLERDEERKSQRR